MMGMLQSCAAARGRERERDRRGGRKEEGERARGRGREGEGEGEGGRESESEREAESAASAADEGREAGSVPREGPLTTYHYISGASDLTGEGPRPSLARLPPLPQSPPSQSLPRRPALHHACRRASRTLTIYPSLGRLPQSLPSAGGVGPAASQGRGGNGGTRH